MRQHLSSGLAGPIRVWHAYTALIVALVVALVLIVVSSLIVTHRVYDLQHSGLSYVQLSQAAPPQNLLSTAPAALPNEPTRARGTIYLKYLNVPFNQGSVGDCQCFAFRYQYQYLANWRKKVPSISPESIIYSCLFWYTEVDQGQDNGSYARQYTLVLSDKGAVPAVKYDWTGTPQHPGSYPQSPEVYNEALLHRYQAYYTSLGYGYHGVGESGRIRSERAIINSHRPVNIATPVYTGPNGFSSDSGRIDLPHQGDVDEGGHAVTLFRSLRDLCLTNAYGENVCGWFEGINSWGRCDFGMTINMKPRDDTPGHCNGGYFLMSFRYVEQYVWSVDALKIAAGTPNIPRAAIAPPWHQPGPSVDRPVPPPKGPYPVRGVLGNWVARVYLKDIKTDMGKVVSNAAHHYHLQPVGFLATLFTECGFNTRSAVCDHIWGGADISFGWCQVTVQTAHGFGIGNGLWDGYTGRNGSFIRHYENNAKKCVWLAARVLGSFKSYLATRTYDRCPIDFPQLYVAWNAGPGNACWFLNNPTPGTTAANNYANGYLRWYQYAEKYSRVKNPYPSHKRKCLKWRNHSCVRRDP